jgi:hypothetical protein
VLAALTILAAATAAAPLIDNERVSVWDVRLAPGEAAPPTPADRDSVIMFLEDGRVRTLAGGRTTEADRRFGEAVFVPKGTRAVDTAVGRPVHEVVVALKDAPHAPIANTSGLPPAFPRPGVVKALETPRVVVWNYSWRPGVATPMHFHDKDVVVAFRYDGALKSVTPSGQETVNAYKAGDIRFNRGDRAHSEVLASERQSAVMMELK